MDKYGICYYSRVTNINNKIKKMKKVILVTVVLVCSLLVVGYGYMRINQNSQGGMVTSQVKNQSSQSSTVVDPSGVRSTVNQQVNPGSVATPTTPNNQAPAKKDPVAVPAGVNLSKEIVCKAGGSIAEASDGYARCELVSSSATYDFEYKEDECQALGLGAVITNEGNISCKFDKQAQLLEGSDGFSNCRIDIANKKVIYNSPVSSCEIDLVNKVVNKAVK